MRCASWNLADVLDFECLLARDSARQDAELRQRERAISEKLPLPTEDSARDPRHILRSWLEARRAEPDASLPGQHFVTVQRWLLTAAVLAGLLLGVSLTATLLSYPDREPVNVSGFLAWTLGLQLLLLLVALLYWIDGKTFRLLGDWRPVQELIAGLMDLLDSALRRFAGENRIRLRAELATLAHKREIYGSLAAWPVVIVTQLFAVAFNVGILGTLLAHSFGRELRFGWQTTWEIESPAAARIVTSVAWPWASAPRAHPTEAQVIATRYAPGQHHATLPAEAMRAWWPFLFYAVALYGLTLRGVLLVVASVQLRRILGRLPFDHWEARALTRRLLEPRTDTPAGASHLVIPSDGDSAKGEHAAGSCIALVAQEMTVDEAALREFLARTFRWDLRQILPVAIDQRHTAGEALAAVREAVPALAGVAVVVPVERDPIVAIALFLKEVAAAGGGRAEVIVLLRGPAELVEQHRLFWRNFNAIHHLHLGLEPWPA